LYYFSPLTSVIPVSSTNAVNVEHRNCHSFVLRKSCILCISDFHDQLTVINVHAFIVVESSSCVHKNSQLTVRIGMSCKLEDHPLSAVCSVYSVQKW
jgi:hypothetical protein